MTDIVLLSSQGKGWFDFGKEKVVEAKSIAEKEAELFANQTNRLAGRTQAEVDQAMDAAKKNAGEAEAKVKSEARGWFDFGKKKGEDVKENVKDGLLSAEKSAERGAQKAQEQTKRL